MADYKINSVVSSETHGEGCEVDIHWFELEGKDLSTGIEFIGEVYGVIYEEAGEYRLVTDEQEPLNLGSKEWIAVLNTLISPIGIHRRITAVPPGPPNVGKAFQGCTPRETLGDVETYLSNFCINNMKNAGPLEQMVSHALLYIEQFEMKADALELAIRSHSAMTKYYPGRDPEDVDRANKNLYGVAERFTNKLRQ